MAQCAQLWANLRPQYKPESLTQTMPSPVVETLYGDVAAAESVVYLHRLHQVVLQQLAKQEEASNRTAILQSAKGGAAK